MSIATEAIDRLHTTASSHKRLMLVDIMGHNTGWLALSASLAGGSDVCLIPEIPYVVRLGPPSAAAASGARPPVQPDLHRRGRASSGAIAGQSRTKKETRQPKKKNGQRSGNDEAHRQDEFPGVPARPETGESAWNRDPGDHARARAAWGYPDPHRPSIGDFAGYHRGTVDRRRSRTV